MNGAVPVLPPTYRPSWCEQGQLYNTLQLMYPRPESGCSATGEETRFIFCMYTVTNMATLWIIKFTSVKHMFCVSVHFTHVLHMTKAVPMWWKSGTKYRGPAVRKGARDLNTLHFFFSVVIIICRIYRSALSDPTQVTVQLRASLFDLVLRLLAGPPLLGSRSRPRRPWNKEHNIRQTLLPDT